MLGLRYLACPDCETVYAVADDPEKCERCGSAALEPLPSDPATAAYFAGALRDDVES